jgi:nifR3 family TIM-barrel protein
MTALTDSWELGGVKIPNRVMLAPLAGIGNWFVRMQARRFGAGLAVSEMVSSHAIHHRNEKTCTELLRIHPDEHPVSVQLFGFDPEIMRSAARTAAQAGADIIDINMGCPVPKVCKTGAGAALLGDPDLAVALARAAREGSGLPVTVKIRSGQRAGDSSGFDLAHRLVREAGAAGIGFHPRAATVHHKGEPDYELAAELVRTLDAPVMLTGGLRGPKSTRAAWEQTGAAAVMLARGSLGNPWLFAQLLGTREPGPPTRDEVLAELDWVIASAIEHLGPARAARYLRKFYPWYAKRLEASRAELDQLSRSDSTTQARELFEQMRPLAPVA